jgi:hypothetical protein
VTAELVLAGASALAPALARAAGRAGAALALRPGGQPPVLGRSDGSGRAVPVPADQDLPGVIAAHLLTALVDGLDPAPAALDGVVLVPAAGACGAAATGPVDAIANDGLLTTKAGGVACCVRLLRAQQTRCWLLAATLRPGPAGPPRPVPGPDLHEADGVIAADTARATQYMQDRGLGSDWPGLLMLGPPEQDPAGTVRLLAAGTDADYADALIGLALRDGGSPR